MLAINGIFQKQFKIIGILGQGGMGIVYLAQDLTDQSYWTIKEQHVIEKNQELLYSEAEILGKLNHPAIPSLRLKHREGDMLYLIMEYVDGCTLEELIHSGQKIGERSIVDWFTQICEILVYLHGLDTPIVYRDLKPSNIMLNRSGQIKLIDFGIAQEYQEKSASVKVAALTRGYAAPEQYDSRYYLDVRTDIYALAVTIHYLITGKDPNQPPYHFRPIRKLNPKASYALESILKKCLQPSPDKRYKDASRLLEDLKQIDELEQDIRKRIKWMRILISSAALLAVCFSLTVFAINRNNREWEIKSYYQMLREAEGSGSFEEALIILERAIEANPENPDAYLAVARMYGLYGRYEEELTYIQEVILDKFPDIYENGEFLLLIEELERLSQ